MPSLHIAQVIIINFNIQRKTQQESVHLIRIAKCNVVDLAL